MIACHNFIISPYLLPHGNKGMNAIRSPPQRVEGLFFSGKKVTFARCKTTYFARET